MARNQTPIKDELAVLKQICDVSPCSIMIFQDERYIFANPTGAQRLGYASPEEIVGLSIWDTIHPSQHKLIRERKQILDRGQRNQVIPLSIIQPDGTNIIVESTSVAIVVNDRPAVLVTGLYSKEREVILSNLKQEKERSQRFLDFLGTIFIVLNTELEVEFINREGLRVLGCNRQETIGKVWNTLAIPADHQEMMHARLTEILPQQKLEFQSPIVTCSGEIRHVSWHATYLDANTEHAAAILLSGDDITDKLITENALRQKTQLLDRMLDGMPDMVSIHDADYNILYSNWKGYADIPKESRHLGKPCHSTYRGFPEPCPDCQAKLVFETKTPIQRQVHLPNEKWVEIRAIPILDSDNNVELVVEMVRDISQIKEAEQALYFSEEKYRNLINTTNTGFVTISGAEGRVLEANQVFVKMTGHQSIAEILGRSVLEFTAPYDIERSRQKIQKCLNSGHIYSLTVDTCSPDGRILPIEINAGTLETSNGVVIQAIIHDISERKDLEKERKRLFNLPMDLLCITNMKGHFKTINPAWATTTGWYENELIGASLFDFIHPDDIKDAIDSTRVFKEGKAVRQMILRFRTKAGSYIWLSWNADPIPSEDSVFAIARDVSKQIEMEESLRSSEAKMKSIFRAAPIGIGVVIKRVFVQINERFCEMTGYSENELLGKSTRMVYRDEEEFLRVGRENRRQHLIQNTGSIETQWVTKTGDTIDILLNSTRIDPADFDKGITFTALDITQKRLEEAGLRHQQKLEAIGTLAGGVAHEINNPINIILNYGNLIHLDAPPDSQISQDAMEIVNESRRIAGIVKNLLAFSRQDQETQSSASMTTIIHDTLSLTHKILEKDQITIETDVADDLPVFDCRPQQLMQVLMNLITNARDALNDKYHAFSPEKRILISATLIEQEGKKQIRTTVEDRGDGIPDSILARIFDPFFTSKQKDKGTGLGLSVSHGIIKDHGGRLHVESKVDHYTRFHFDLPLEG